MHELATIPQSRHEDVCRRWGCVALIAALAVLMLPQSGLLELLGVPNSSCAGLGPLLMSWGGALALGLTGGLLLLHPVSGSYAATALGALSLAGFTATIVDGTSLPNWHEMLLAGSVIGALPSLQLVLGLWLLSLRRRAAAASAC